MDASDRAMQIRHLAQAERHVLQGEKHIAGQEQLIAELARHGHNTAQASELLDSFYAIQALHIQHRDRILKELGR
jgi:hypothetical protein